MIERLATIPGGPPQGGAYSHAVIANGFVFISGQGPVDPATGKMPDNFEAQVRQVLTNLKTALEAAGSDLAHIVKVNAYLTDMSRFAEYNKIYREMMPAELPARTTVGVSMPGFLVEIDCIAAQD
ncbi:MAG: RidA family protein [Formivibrio sp.]|nr:RidA family protein [Formivibrio sp.]